MERSADEIRQAIREAFRTIMPLIRRELWKPDGKPPEDWDERREGSVVKRLLRWRTSSQLEIAIYGLAMLRDRGEITWLRAGEKVTTRALYNTRSGVTQVYEQAVAAYWRDTKKRKPQRLPDSVKDILRKMSA